MMKASPASPSKRDPALDAAKGLLILTVVVAHCFTEGALHDFIFSFHIWTVNQNINILHEIAFFIQKGQFLPVKSRKKNHA